MNSNLEIVLIDFLVLDKLYFELLMIEDVLNVIEFEKLVGVIV